MGCSSTLPAPSLHMYIVPYAFDGKKMECRRGDAPVEDDAEVAAYLPYNGQTAGDRLIPL